MVAEFDCPECVVTPWVGLASALMEIVHARTHTANTQTCRPLLASRFAYADRRHRLVPTPRKEAIDQMKKSYPWNVQAHTCNVSLSPRVAVKQNGLRETES